MKVATFVFTVSVLAASCACEDRGLRDLHTYERLAASEKWSVLAETARRNWLDYGDEVDANYYHLAQAYMGRLVEDLFRTKQTGPYGLLFLSDRAMSDPRCAYVLFAMGHYTGAQYYASGALLTPEGLDYAMLKMLVRLELIRGNDKVAEKYVRLLRKKGKFAEWAEHVRNDPQIEMRRNDRYGEDFFPLESLCDDLDRIVAANPSDAMAMQYYLSYALLSKNVSAVFKIVDRYFGTPALKELPTPAQEALLVLWDYLRVSGEDTCSIDLDYCFSHGVTERTFVRFDRFQTARFNDNWMMLSQFSDTFWYYDLFTEI